MADHGGPPAHPIGALRDWVSIGASFALTVQLVAVVLAVSSTVIPGWRSVAVTSGSMQPALDAGDIVLVREGAAPSPNAVVLVRRDGEIPLLHRVVGVNDDDSLVTRGDANGSNDPIAVPLDHVLGVGRVAVPAVGLPLIWIGNGGVMQILVLVAVELALIVAASQMKRRELAIAGVGVAVPLSDRHVARLRTGVPSWVRAGTPSSRVSGPP